MALAKKNRLIDKKDFDKIFKEGKTVKGSFLFIKVLKKDKGLSRYGFSVPVKTYPKAVDRNRLRRVLSEAVRTSLSDSRPYDIVVVISKKNEETLLIKEMLQLLNKII